MPEYHFLFDEFNAIIDKYKKKISRINKICEMFGIFCRMDEGTTYERHIVTYLKEKYNLFNPSFCYTNYCQSRYRAKNGNLDHYWTLENLLFKSNHDLKLAIRFQKMDKKFKARFHPATAWDFRKGWKYIFKNNFNEDRIIHIYNNGSYDVVITPEEYGKLCEYIPSILEEKE